VGCGQWIVFEGISVDETGKQHFLDASVAYKRAVLNAVDYLSKFGYTREQIYLLLSCAPSEGRISGLSPRLTLHASSHGPQASAPQRKHVLFILCREYWDADAASRGPQAPAAHNSNDMSR